MPTVPDIQTQLTEQTRAIIDRRDVSQFPSTDQEAAVKKAQELRKAAESKADRQAMLRQYAEQRVTDERILQFAEHSVPNTMPDAVTGKRTGTEAGEFDTLVAQGRLIKRYIEGKNIDALVGGDEAARRKAKDAVIRLAELLPGADQIFIDLKTGKPMSESERRVFITGLMNDPEFIRVVSQVFSERTDPNTAKQMLAEAMQKRRQFEDAKVAVQRAEKEQDKLVQEIRDINDELAKFSVQIDNSGNITSRGEYAQKIDDIDQAIAKILNGETEATFIANRKGIIENLQKQLSNIQRLLDKQPPNYKSLQKDFNNVVNQLATYEEPLNRLNELKKDKNEYEEKKKELQKNLEDKQKQLDQTKDRLDDARRALGIASAEWELAKPLGQLNLESVVTEAASRYFTEKMTQIEEAQREILEKEIAQTQNAEEKKILEQLGQKWMKVETRGAVAKFFKGDRGYEVDKYKVDQHFHELLINGPDAFRKLAFDFPISDEVWAKVQDRVIQTLIQRKLRAGGLKEGEAEIIFNSPWGNEVITKAIAENARFNSDVLAKLQEAGVLEGQDMGSIRKAIGKHRGLVGILLLLIFGAGAVSLLSAGLATEALIGASGGGGGFLGSRVMKGS